MKERNKMILYLIILLIILSPQYNCCNISNQTNNKYFKITNEPLEDSMDQYQLLWNAGIGIGYPDILAQSFKPSKNTLTRVQLLIYKTENSQNNISVSIREMLDGADLANKTISIEDISFDRSWVTFDFPNISLASDKTYYIILKPLGGGMNLVWNGYDNNNFNSYVNGEAWLFTGNQWSTEGFIIKDWSFITYGYHVSQPPRVPEKPDGPVDGFSWITYNYTSNSSDPEGDDICYGWDWNGDEIVDEWTEFFQSGKSIKETHYWEQSGTYLIRVKAADEYGVSSDFSEAFVVNISNDPPLIPMTPKGPFLGFSFEEFFYQSNSTDPEGDDICYGWDWNGDEIVDEWTEFFQSGESVLISHTWNSTGLYYVQVRAQDEKGALSVFSEPLQVIIVSRENDPPEKPSIPLGPKFGRSDISYTFGAVANDPNGDRIWYLWDWDDGTNTSWIGPFNSGQPCNVSHNWNQKGSFQVKVKVRDEMGEESVWSDPAQMTLPKSKSKNFLFIDMIYYFLFVFLNSNTNIIDLIQ